MIFHSDENINKTFSLKLCTEKEKNQYEVLPPSLFPTTPNDNESCIASCKKCDICKNYLLTNNKFSPIQDGFFWGYSRMYGQKGSPL